MTAGLARGHFCCAVQLISKEVAPNQQGGAVVETGDVDATLILVDNQTLRAVSHSEFIFLHTF